MEGIPDELVPLYADFPGWQFGVRWTTAATGPDARTLFAWRDGVTLTAPDAATLRRKIRESA